MKKSTILLALASALVMCAYAFLIIQSIEPIELLILNLSAGLWNFNQVIVRLAIGSMLISLPLSILYAFQRVSIRFMNRWLLTVTILCVLIFTLITLNFPWSSKSSILLFITALLSLLVGFQLINKTESQLKGNSIIRVIFVSLAIVSGLVLAFVLAPSYPIYFSKIQEPNEPLAQKFTSSTLNPEGKKITLFASVNCPHCHRVISYLDIAISNNEIDPNDVVIHFPEGEAMVSNYLEQFDTPPPHTLITKEQFIEYTAGRYPLTYFTKEGKVSATWHTKGFTYSDIPIIKSLLND